MTTGHWNPGYCDTVSRFRRAKSALPAGSSAGARSLQETMNMDLDSATLDDIRERAKDMWLQPDRNETSYNDHYKERFLDITDITSARPTSGGRRNKPHPPAVFLTTRLHSVPGYGRLQDIPGYHNPDTTIGKDAYRMDRSLPAFEQDYRNDLKAKYIGRPHTAAVNQYKTIQELEVIKDPVERQGMEAYLKLATKQDQRNILANLREIQDEEEYSYIRPVEQSYRPKTVPSLNRYLREAGAQEAQHLDDISNRRKGFRTNYSMDVGTKRRLELESMRNPTYTHPTKRGDFLIHPEWTPKFTHHRLNGLSSVDIPHNPGRR